MAYSSSLIIRDFKGMDRLPIASGFNAIQNNSDLSQGLGPRLAAQLTTRVAGICLNTETGHEHVGHAVRASVGHCAAQSISLTGDHRRSDGGTSANGCGRNHRISCTASVRFIPDVAD